MTVEILPEQRSEFCFVHVDELIKQSQKQSVGLFVYISIRPPALTCPSTSLSVSVCAVLVSVGQSLPLAGWIQSPGFPQGYGSDLTETWRRCAPPGHVLSLTLLHLDLEESYECENDALKVEDRKQLAALFLLTKMFSFSFFILCVVLLLSLYFCSFWFIVAASFLLPFLGCIFSFFHSGFFLSCFWKVSFVFDFPSLVCPLSSPPFLRFLRITTSSLTCVAKRPWRSSSPPLIPRSSRRQEAVSLSPSTLITPTRKDEQDSKLFTRQRVNLSQGDHVLGWTSQSSQTSHGSVES